jgi:hypothetical protein
MKLTCPKFSQSCQTGDYQIKVINKLPRPEPNFDWLNKPSLFDRFLTYSFPLLCGLGWLLILLAIFSS